MRSLTGTETSTLQSPNYWVSALVEIQNGDGTWIDITSLEGFNWLDGVTWSLDVDQPISTATIRIRRDAGSLSSAPFIEGSVINRLDDGMTYSPLLDAGRRIRVSAATTPTGTEPLAGDFHTLFDGFTDQIEWGSSEVRVFCRDLGALLVDTFIDTRRTYGDESGVPIEDVMQQILDDNLGSGVVTLFTPTSPGFLISPAFEQDIRESVWDALTTLRQLIGWDLRYRWDDGTSSFRLTFLEPDRNATVPVWTFGPSDYLDVTHLDVDRTEVRTRVRVTFIDSATGEEDFREAINTETFLRYGDRLLHIIEGTGSPIDTGTEAQNLADSVLADVGDPIAEQEIETIFWWPGQLNDLYRFTANDVHYDVDQDWAATSIRHQLGMNQHRTFIRVRGKPSGGFLTWLTEPTRPDEEQQLPFVVSIDPDQIGSTGRLDVNVQDPNLTITAIEYQIRQGTTPFPGVWLDAWDQSTGTPGSSVILFRRKDIALTTKHTSEIKGRISYVDAAGSPQEYIFAHPFDLDNVAETLNVEVLFGTNRLTEIAATFDEDARRDGSSDTAYVTVAVGVAPPDPTPMANDGVIVAPANSRTGSVMVDIPVPEGDVAHVKIVAVNDAGVLGPVAGPFEFVSPGFQAWTRVYQSVPVCTDPANLNCAPDAVDVLTRDGQLITPAVAEGEELWFDIENLDSGERVLIVWIGTSGIWDLSEQDTKVIVNGTNLPIVFPSDFAGGEPFTGELKLVIENGGVPSDVQIRVHPRLQGAPPRDRRSVGEVNFEPALAATSGNFVDAGGAVLNVKHPQFGAQGTGDVDDTPALAAADGFAPTTNLIPRGTYRVDTDLTLSSATKFEEGAVIQPNAGQTVTFDGPIDAGRYKIIDLSLDGTVAIGTGPSSMSELLPEWLGAVTDGSTDSLVPIQTAIDIMSAGGGGGVRFGKGHYVCDGPLHLKSNVSIIGDGLDTLLENVSTEANASFRTLFSLGSYGPSGSNYTPFDSPNPYAVAAGALHGEFDVTLSTIGDAADFEVGDIVFLFNHDRVVEDLDDVFEFMQINKVVGVNAGTGVITLENPLYKDFDGTSPTVVIDRLSGLVANFDNTLPSRVAEGVIIRDVRVKPSTENATIPQWCRPGGAYRCNLHNIVVEGPAQTLVELQLSAYQITRNVTGRFNQYAASVAYWSHDCLTEGLIGTFHPDPAAQAAPAVVRIHENGHHNTVRNVRATIGAEESFSNVVRIGAQAAEHNIAEDISVYGEGSNVGPYIAVTFSENVANVPKQGNIIRRVTAVMPNHSSQHVRIQEQLPSERKDVPIRIEDCHFVSGGNATRFLQHLGGSDYEIRNVFTDAFTEEVNFDTASSSGFRCIDIRGPYDDNIPRLQAEGGGSNSATPFVLVGDKFFAQNSMATTVTQFVGGWIGKLITIQATNTNTTIQHGTNIFLRSGANKTLATDEVIQFVQFAQDVWVEVGPTDVLFTTGDVMDGRLIIRETGVTTPLRLDDVAGTGNFVQYTVGNLNRWNAGRDGIAETGGDAGSDYRILRYDDSGSVLGTAVLIERATGNVTTEADLRVSGTFGVGNSASATAVSGLTRVMEVFDETGTSLGFVPIYTSFS